MKLSIPFFFISYFQNYTNKIKKSNLQIWNENKN